MLDEIKRLEEVATIREHKWERKQEVVRNKLVVVIGSFQTIDRQIAAKFPDQVPEDSTIEELITKLHEFANTKGGLKIPHTTS